MTVRKGRRGDVQEVLRASLGMIEEGLPLRSFHGHVRLRQDRQEVCDAGRTAAEGGEVRALVCTVRVRTARPVDAAGGRLGSAHLEKHGASG